MRSTSKFVDLLLEAGAFASDPIVHVDVGASGGISSKWRVFAPALTAIGFEPLLREVDRLNAESPSPSERYEAFFVGCPSKSLPADIAANPASAHNTLRWQETSAFEYQQITGRSHAEEVFNRGDPDRSVAAETITLDEYFFERTADVPTVDFIKIDTDGSDLQVLFGAERLLRDKEVLGIQIEAQLHGRTHPFSNTFANIDQFLRERGFALFDFPLYKYSRRALPAKFAVPQPGRTVSGQTHFGDALYFRDIADPDYASKYGCEMGQAKALKLAALFALFDLPDCAADLILSRREEFERAGNDTTAWLDSLVPPLNGVQLSYDDYMTVFRAAPTTFLKGNDGHEGWSLPQETIEAGKQACREIPRTAEERLVHLQKDRHRIKGKLETLREEVKGMREQQARDHTMMATLNEKLARASSELAIYKKKFGWMRRFGLVK